MAGIIFVRQEESTQAGLDPQHREEIARGVDRPDALWVSCSGQIFVAADGQSHLFESVVAIFDVEILCGRKPVLRDVESRRGIPENHQSVGILVRQRLQEKRIHDTEYRNGCSHADGDRQNGGHAECRVLLEHTQGKAEILCGFAQSVLLRNRILKRDTYHTDPPGWE